MVPRKRNWSLSPGVAASQIAWVKLVTNFGGGLGGDNWNLDTLTIQDEVKGVLLYTKSGKPLVRFTAREKTFTAQL